MVVILMGVSGVGKTTLGRRLAAELGWRFVDGDDVHSPASVAKMAVGIPLTDEDRAPWLERLRELVVESLQQGKSLVLACSALRRSYRQVLTVDPARVKWVYLRGARALIESRLMARTNHFMPPSLLDSQLATLEEPEDALKVDVTLDPVAVVTAIRTGLGL